MVLIYCCCCFFYRINRFFKQFDLVERSLFLCQASLDEVLQKRIRNCGEKSQSKDNSFFVLIG